MNQVSEFTINQKVSSLTQANSCTPQSYHSRSVQKKQLEVPTTVSAFQQSNYKCTQCADHLSALTKVKKQQILLEYQIQKLKEEIDRLKRENQHLVQVQYSHHKTNLEKYNPIIYFKEDLESQLYEAKYLLELHILSKSQDQNNIKPLNIKQSKKQKECIQQISKPVDLKKKCEDLLMENIKLQEKNMIKDKIIEERSLFPLYHYDQRILTLRKAVEFWYRKAEQGTVKLNELIGEVKKMQKEVKKQTKIIVQQERIFWENEMKKVLHQLNHSNISYQPNENYKSTKVQVSNSYESSKSGQNQDHQKRTLYNSERGNILIEDDHTILSICQKMKEKKQNLKPKETKRKSVAAINGNLCESCILDEKKGSKCNMKGNNKSVNKSVNKSAKNSAKDELKNSMNKYETKGEECKRKTVRKQNQNQGINSSMMGKNFENIEIKLKQKEKCDQHNHVKKNTINTSQKLPLSQINCQRCAQRLN